MKVWKLSKYNLGNLINILENLDFSKNWEVVIREAKASRSLEQNSRLWELYTSIAEYTGYTKDEIHDLMGYKFLREQRQVGDEVFESIKSTTKLNTKEMSDYQDQIVLWASQMGWGWHD
jgi:hypothetical protein